MEFFFKMIMFLFFLFASLSESQPGFGFGPGEDGSEFWSKGAIKNGLSVNFYDKTCPKAKDIVLFVVGKAILEEPRNAASLLRLLFHDCFAQGCDGSLLLDDSPTIQSEKKALANINSVRGFEFIDEIKARLEETCPLTVSCADILALAARAAVLLSGGPTWEVPLGRRDSKTASITAADTDIPPPSSTLQNLIDLFKRQGLDETDLVALSGGHTIGVARCANFKARLYNQTHSQAQEKKLLQPYIDTLKLICPKTGGDDNVAHLDFVSPILFDNSYFKRVALGMGLLNSDDQLLTGKSGSKSMKLVKAYAADQILFFNQFAKSMVKMGNIKVLTGKDKGEIRKNCRKIN